MSKKRSHSLGIPLSKFHEAWAYVVSLAMFASGVFWLLSHRFMAVEGPFGPEPNPIESWCLKIHGAAAMLFLVLLGTLLPIHIYRNWRLGRNLKSAVALLLPVLVLIVTGYGLYYAGDEDLRSVAKNIHWIVGLVSFIPFALHVVIGKRKRSLSHEGRERING